MPRRSSNSAAITRISCRCSPRSCRIRILPNPTDTNQLTEEIAQLSQVQQEINMNNTLSTIASDLVASQTSNAVSYIGKQIDATVTSGSPAQTELTNSQATLVYNLPAGASTATVTITNSAGQTVFSAPGTTVSGRNQVEWNGQTSSRNDGAGRHL